MLQKSIVSVDMGGTKILASIINSKEGIVVRVKKATDPNSSKAEYIDSLAGIVKDVINEAGIKKKTTTNGMYISYRLKKFFMQYDSSKKHCLISPAPSRLRSDGVENQNL